MQYALLIYSEPRTEQPAEEEMAAELGKWFAYSKELEDKGAMLGGQALDAVDTATTVRVRSGEVLATDGPFAETKEVLGGFYLIEAADLDEAIEWASKIPSVGEGSVEVRPIWQVPEEPS